MKHPIVLFVLAFCLIPNLSLYSQYEYNTPNYADYIPMKMSPSFEASSQNVKKIVYDVTKTSPKKAEKYVKYFDELGNLTHFIRLNYKNDTLEEGFFTFIGKEKLSQSTVYKKSKLTFSTRWTYDQKQKLISFVRENGKKKVQSMGKWKRNDKSFTTESVLYKKDTTKFNYKWVYEFNEDDSPAKTTLYQKNGKIKRIWSYHCSPAGEKVEKNEVQFCRDTRSDDEYTYYTWRTVGEKGKVEKTVKKYTLKDHFLLESCTYNESERLLYKQTYDRSEDRLLSSVSYDKKGNQSVSYFYTYENERPISYKFYIGKKILMNRVMKYNAEGQLTEQLNYDSKGKLHSTIKTTYEM